MEQIAINFISGVSCTIRANDGVHCAYNILDAPQVPSERNSNNMPTKPKLRYTLGRTNAKGKGKNHTLKFHVNPYFGCVTANRFTNRETWIAEIK
jgi:hypothetical protein